MKTNMQSSRLAKWTPAHRAGRNYMINDRNGEVIEETKLPVTSSAMRHLTLNVVYRIETAPVENRHLAESVARATKDSYGRYVVEIVGAGAGCHEGFYPRLREAQLAAFAHNRAARRMRARMGREFAVIA